MFCLSTHYLKSQGVTLNDTKKRRFRKTPVMTLCGLQRLMMEDRPSTDTEVRLMIFHIHKTNTIQMWNLLIGPVVFLYQFLTSTDDTPE